MVSGESGRDQDKKEDPSVIHAEPTKEFFIEMLVRDIPLTRAIIDLIDNSVDGARRMRPEGRYTGLWIQIEARPDRFEVTDNCGGIPKDTARMYAFRFGRPPEMKATLHSVGQFGVGMKRALFKLGSRFQVISHTASDHFKIDEDVREWRAKPEWTFSFKPPGDAPRDTNGTTVRVLDLHAVVKSEFGLENFHSELSTAIRDAHIDGLGDGLSITYNGTPIMYEPLEMLASSGFEPAHLEKSVTGAAEALPMTIKTYAGLGKSDPQHAGWYIFCNGRQVLGADQTEATGWGAGNGKTIPRYHNQFAMFRGYVFFDCDDAGRVPWNTTKNSVDIDSPAYRSARQDMITLMRPVINFLNQLDKEKGDPDEHMPLHEAVATMGSVSLREMVVREKFTYPHPPPRPALPRTGRIQYNKEVEKIVLAKNALGVTTYTDVGKCTFDYYFDRECE